jgi:hypothetical protein
MSSEEERLRRTRIRNRNIYAKILHDPNEFRGAFRMKIHDERKGEYRRVKMKVKNVNDYEEDD